MTAFGMRGPAATPAIPLGVAVPVRGCVGWFDLQHANLPTRRKNQVKPRAADMTFGASVVQDVSFTTIGSGVKRIITGIQPGNDVTYLMLVRSPNIPDNNNDAATRCRAMFDFVSNAGGNTFGFHKDEWRFYLDGVSGEPDDVLTINQVRLKTVTPMTTWHLGAAVYKAGDYVAVYDLTDGVYIKLPKTGQPRVLSAIPLALGGDSPTGASFDCDMRWAAIFNRALSDREIEVVASIPRAIAAAQGITV